MRLRLTLLGLCAVFSAAGVQAQETPAAENSVATYRSVMDRYCVTCHNETLKTANLMLDKADINDLNAEPMVWEKVLLKMQTRSMPPVGMPRPDEAFYIEFGEHLERELDLANQAGALIGQR